MFIDLSNEERRGAYERMLAPYPALREYTVPLSRMKRDLVGRDREIRELMAAFERPELSNVILLGQAGAGKTSIVRGCAVADQKRFYLEVDIARMIEGLANDGELGSRLTQLFDEVAQMQTGLRGYEIVLFIDEFHKIVQKSPSAVEDLKPLLADSGTRGVRVVAATTYVEFREWIAPNQPLVERLQRVNIGETDHDMTVAILRAMCERYDVRDEVADSILENIYQYTNRYIPANAQPRKSILVLDAMIGWHRAEGRRMDRELLGDVIYESEGIRVDTSVDPGAIEDEINRAVYSQEYAARVVAKRMHLCLAGLNDPTRPQSVLLETGSTGTGKTFLAKTLARLLFGDAHESFIRFDMTEFSQPASVERFRRDLTNAVWAHPFCVLLLDEVEKASGEVTRLLLPVLDDARLTDENGREVTFANAHIILTTNAGAEVYSTLGDYEQGADMEEILDRYDALIRSSLTNTNAQNKFPPELLGRLDAIVPFRPLGLRTMDAIVERELKHLRDKLWHDRGVDVNFDRRVKPYICEDKLTTDSDAGGARGVIKRIESDVTSAVARYINTYPDASALVVEISGELASENKYSIKGSGHIVVREIAD